MKRRFGILFILLSILCLSLCSCQDKNNALEIFAEDVVDIPAGEYTLQYTISDYEIYRESYHLSLTVRVYNENNIPLTVTNNRTVTLENEHIYTVYIRLEGTVDGETLIRQKQYTITTQKNNLTVSFLLRDGTVSQYYKEFSVQYGADLPLSVVSDTPPAYYNTAQEKVGYSRTIISSRWVIKTQNGEEELTQQHLMGITEDKQIFSSYEYEYTPITYTVHYEENGGTEVPDKVSNITALLAQPTRPTREGYVFLGWCDDEELTTFHNWRTEKYVDSDMTLFARWEKDNTESATGANYFSFSEETDNYGNKYYVLSVKDKNKLSQDRKNIVLPNAHDGLPVREIKNGAFSSCAIESVYIPATYTLALNRAFADCDRLQKAEFEKTNERTHLSESIFSCCTALTEVILPDNLIVINVNCFYSCLNLTTVVLPSSLVQINDRAFQNCASLATVSFPDALQFIGADAFLDCSSLSSVLFGESSALTSADSSAFNGTAIRKITLPISLQGQDIAFDNRNIVIEYYSKTE